MLCCYCTHHPWWAWLRRPGLCLAYIIICQAFCFLQAAGWVSMSASQVENSRDKKRKPERRGGVRKSGIGTHYKPCRSLSSQNFGVKPPFINRYNCRQTSVLWWSINSRHRSYHTPFAPAFYMSWTCWITKKKTQLFLDVLDHKSLTKLRIV